MSEIREVKLPGVGVATSGDRVVASAASDGVVASAGEEISNQKSLASV